MPENITNLEKAIYIYIKMCKLLTYDEEYYAVNQRGEVAEKHKSIDYISSITLDNNKVVCFEFNLMYSNLLNKLGINFASSYGKNAFGMENPFGEDSYGEGHSNLEFRVNKFLISVDAVTSILQGDIFQAKLNQPLVGLNCINKNKKTQYEFKEMVTKIYQLIVEQEKKLDETQQVEHVQTLDELLKEYSKLTTNIHEISLNERLSILIDKVNSTKMVGIDSMAYILQLRKILFTNDQINNNIKVTIIRNNESFEDEKVATVSAIFTLNAYNIDESEEQNIYYYYNPNCELISITKEELQVKFNDGIFEFVGNDCPKIPGIIENGGIKR